MSWHGEAGKARCGEVRPGKVRHDRARFGKVWRGGHGFLKEGVARLIVTGATNKRTNTPVDVRTVRVKVVGDSPLITYRFPSIKSDKGTVHVDHFGPRKIQERNPVKEFIEAIYWYPNEEMYPGVTSANAEAQAAETMDEFLLACGKGARFGFPADRIKDAAIDAAYALGKAPNKVSLRGLFFIEPDDKSAGLLEIKSDPPIMREYKLLYSYGHISKIYRPEFPSWSCEFNLSYNANGAKTLDEIMTLIDMGGCACGIGEWRPKEGGKYGTFHVER